MPEERIRAIADDADMIIRDDAFKKNVESR